MSKLCDTHSSIDLFILLGEIQSVRIAKKISDNIETVDATTVFEMKMHDTMKCSFDSFVVNDNLNRSSIDVS